MNEPYPRNYERQNAMITTLAAPYSHTSTMFVELSEHAKTFRRIFAARVFGGKGKEFCSATQPWSKFLLGKPQAD